MVFSLFLDAPATYKVFTLTGPNRVVVDLSNTNIQGQLKQGVHDRPPLKAIRYAERPDGSLRIVLDMTQAVNAKSTLTKQSAGQYMLEIALTPDGKTTGKSPAVAPKETKASAANKAEKRVESVTSTPAKGKFIVVIDPGHGGKDPGAIGRNGTQEKDVVLEIARKLRTQINREKGMKAILTRDSDIFIPLRSRMDIAHQYKADLFISIHADANPRSSLSGSSVYILSKNGASSEAARLLAESENSYELKFGDRNLSDTQNRLASVLLDLSQTAMMDRSLNGAKGVLAELRQIATPLRSQVESAQFMVLRSPDIPSMLVETAFISNPAEEKRLRTGAYQQKLANAMFKGVKRYQVAYAGGTQRAA
jgi:N-acetylmuramoyl-L-alanine amidase